MINENQKLEIALYCVMTFFVSFIWYAIRAFFEFSAEAIIFYWLILFVYGWLYGKLIKPLFA